MCVDQRLHQPAGGRTECRLASVYSSSQLLSLRGICKSSIIAQYIFTIYYSYQYYIYMLWAINKFVLKKCGDLSHTATNLINKRSTSSVITTTLNA